MSLLGAGGVMSYLSGVLTSGDKSLHGTQALEISTVEGTGTGRKNKIKREK